MKLHVLSYCLMYKNIFFSNGGYIDCLSLTYATNKSKKVKLHYKYYIKREKTKKNFQSIYKSPNDKE